MPQVKVAGIEAEIVINRRSVSKDGLARRDGHIWFYPVTSGSLPTAWRRDASFGRHRAPIRPAHIRPATAS